MLDLMQKYFPWGHRHNFTIMLTNHHASKNFYKFIVNSCEFNVMFNNLDWDYISSTFNIKIKRSC